MVTLFLTNLEPIRYLSNEFLYNVGSKVDHMVFLLDGNIEVGYNHHSFLKKHDLNPNQDVSVLEDKNLI